MNDILSYTYLFHILSWKKFFLNDNLFLDTTEEPVDLLPDCARTPFGCCNDNYTAAHGPDMEGCCLVSPYGCCPNYITEAWGPNNQGNWLIN